MIAALVLYGLAVLAVGAFAARSASSNPAAFLVGDRRFGTLQTWAALSSTTIGGSTTLVLAALVATKGLSGLWLDLAGSLGLLFLGLFLARSVRRTGALTISEVIGGLYGPRVRRVAAVLVVMASVVWFALLTQATETVVTAATDWPPGPVLVVTAALFVAYTALGGQRAVVGTDVLQLGMMTVAILGIALPLALVSLSLTAAPPALLSFPFGPGLGPLDAIGLLVLVGLPHAVGSDVWAKLLSARDEGVARRAALGAAAYKLVFGLAVATVALAGVARGTGGPPASIFPRTILELAGPALAPFLLVAMIATMQSSSDSVLLSAAGATAHDLLPERTGPGAIRALVVVFGAFGLLVALWLRDLVETFRLGYTIFASGLILPTLAAFLPRVRVVPAFAGAAMVAGGVAALATRAFGDAPVDPVLVGTGVNAVVLLCGLRSASGRISPGRRP